MAIPASTPALEYVHVYTALQYSIRISILEYCNTGTSTLCTRVQYTRVGYSALNNMLWPYYNILYIIANIVQHSSVPTLAIAGTVYTCVHVYSAPCTVTSIHVYQYKRVHSVLLVYGQRSSTVLPVHIIVHKLFHISYQSNTLNKKNENVWRGYFSGFIWSKHRDHGLDLSVME